MRKIYFLLIIVTISFSNYAQIAITEVYYDTPIIERLERSSMAHLGEFIELFNYSTEDINISGWRLSDNSGSYIIPQGTIIASNDYLIVARRYLSEYYFFDLFPNEEAGNENKVLYQSSLVMNNYRDFIKLSTKRIVGQTLKRYYTISKVIWSCGGGIPCDRNPINPTAMENSSNSIPYNTEFNYYVPSLQKFHDQDLTDISQSLSSSVLIATPFNLNFTPELLDIEDIQHVDNILTQNYYSLTVDERVDYYVNMDCDNSIAIVSSGTVSDTYIEDQCFYFDTAGNQEQNTLCPENENSDSGSSTDTTDTTDNTNTTDTAEDLSLEEIANKIYVMPNPTSGLITISWEDEISNVITQIVITPMSGAYFEIPVSFSSGSNSASSNLSPYSTGMYVVRFTLNSGEVVTKTIIKI